MSRKVLTHLIRAFEDGGSFDAAIFLKASGGLFILKEERARDTKQNRKWKKGLGL